MDKICVGWDQGSGLNAQKHAYKFLKCPSVLQILVSSALLMYLYDLTTHPLCCSGNCIFFTLKAKVLFPFLSVHIKENIINQLQEKKRTVCIKGWRGELYSSLQVLHIDAYSIVMYMLLLLLFFSLMLFPHLLSGENKKKSLRGLDE